MGNTIWHSVDGKMFKIGNPKGRTQNINFLITCKFGDWSGFRTLLDCEKQIPDLEQMMKEDPSKYYNIVER
jgi:hypothetical protein